MCIINSFKEKLHIDTNNRKSTTTLFPEQEGRCLNKCRHRMQKLSKNQAFMIKSISLSLLNNFSLALTLSLSLSIYLSLSLLLYLSLSLLLPLLLLPLLIFLCLPLLFFLALLLLLLCLPLLGELLPGGKVCAALLRHRTHRWHHLQRKHHYRNSDGRTDEQSSLMGYDKHKKYARNSYYEFKRLDVQTYMLVIHPYA